jgi:hypothetical protein
MRFDVWEKGSIYMTSPKPMSAEAKHRDYHCWQELNILYPSQKAKQEGSSLHKTVIRTWEELTTPASP